MTGPWGPGPTLYLTLVWLVCRRHAPQHAVALRQGADDGAMGSRAQCTRGAVGAALRWGCRTRRCCLALRGEERESGERRT
eukprot:356865-Chlamydomonas_euryale.AAC.1